MFSLRVYIVTLALAVKLDNVQASTWNSPITIYYKHMDILKVDIILDNVPTEANYYVLYYQTGNCDRKTTKQVSGAGCKDRVPQRRTWIPKNKTITIIQKLDRESVRIYLELNKDRKICATKIILDGIKDPNADANPFYQKCFHKIKYRCYIFADFGNTCEEQTSARLHYTHSEGHLTFEIDDQELPEDAVHQWYQVYRDGTSIGPIPTVKGSQIEYKIIFHKFDSNTYIHSTISSNKLKNDLTTQELKVPLPTNKYNNYEFSRIEIYTESKNFLFTCPDNPYTRIGRIEATGNKITTYDKSQNLWGLSKEHNGVMFCCINYSFYTDGNKKGVERAVSKITFLKYEERVIQNHVMVTTTDPGLTTSSLATQNTPAVSPDTNPWTESTVPSNPADPGKADHHSVSSPDNSIYYIVTAAVAGLIILALLIYVVIKKCCRKVSDPEQTIQLDTYATSNMVLYAELDIRPGQAPAPASNENATYAEIIGVLRPKEGHVNQ